MEHNYEIQRETSTGRSETKVVTTPQALSQEIERIAELSSVDSVITIRIVEREDE